MLPHRRTIFWALALAIAGASPLAAEQRSVTVFAAASLKNALDDVIADFQKATGTKVVASYAASGPLIRQIEQGAPADIFISADLDWMDWGQERKLIDVTTRANLLGNRLVLIAPANSPVAAQEIKRGFDIAALAGSGRIATGEPRSVPVGAYAMKAIEYLGPGTRQPQYAFTDSVRAALALVARGEAPLGIVYATDAKVEPGVKVIGVFPEESHPPVLYPVAATATAKGEAGAFLVYLASAPAKAVFERYGFSYLVTPRS